VSNAKFQLSISLNALEHLGINLYSNVPSVLSEIVANAWDADAEAVEVTWDRGSGKIVIKDDGTGMTQEEVNGRFLKVGHRRRDEQPGLTAKGRHPMGRKGIGKLSLFSIADTVVVETVKGGEKSAFRMKLEDIRVKVQQEGGSGTYEPTPVETDQIDFPHGTRITLSNLRHRQTVATTRALKKRVARRFSILGPKHDFRVIIDGEEVTPADRDYYNKVQYLWRYGDNSEIESLFTNLEHNESREIIQDADVLKLSGWLGTVKESGQLKDEEGENLNRIAIFIRGKMAQEDLLSDFSERGVYANYLIGELRVEGLDLYDGPGTDRDDDAATSSRQKIVEDDERYQKLRDIILGELKYIQNRWGDLRADAGAKKAMDIPAVKAWLDNLKPPVRKKAQRWLGKLNRIEMDKLDEQKQLFKHAVLGFEFYRLHENLDALEAISDDDIPAALELFQELDGLEANLYGQIVQQRISVIRALQQKVEENALERAIQQYLFDHLWLLDPSWERVEGTEVIETNVRSMFQQVDATLSSEQKLARLDIAYRKAAGEHIIIELKRPDRVVTVPDMIEQSEKYLSGMLELLREAGTPHEPVEIVFVLGAPPREWKNIGGQDRSVKALGANEARVVFYKGLLDNAYKSYSEYIAERGVVDKLGEVIRAIDDYAPLTDSE
jgi:hypothetical protein